MKPTNLLAGVVLYCRAGFEKEAAAEIQQHALDLGVQGYVKAQPASAYLLFTPYDPATLDLLRAKLRFADLCFARQLIYVAPLIQNLPADDRITPLLAAAATLAPRYSAVWLETADTNEAKALSVFVRKFETPFRRAVERAGAVDEKSSQLPRLHLFFIDSATVYLGLSWLGNASPWVMGIPRLRFPRNAPSRSTLKLEEAFHTFLEEPERALQPGMKAVDLGAAPGGWTWQLVRRSLRVTAVDNGPMAPELLDSGIVEHLRADGFRYRPPSPVDWLVCDMVEQPARIAALVARWLAEGYARQAIFNLKLPMKKRYEEVERCRDIIARSLEQAGVGYALAFKQLYHDREEVTGFLRLAGRTGERRGA
ncbi:23S rRNA (cytidine(2498)-2'-O)-methyltransferase RlmM [Methylococcus sp. EFPC2]|uniref:23S rRNA (cytidine(2498)-2'-O)-methyltransferase RlmM n=1 Tax=Methylococcus sp. EFPC2 TaxID=2812648 RepID=UPI001966DC5B|nr:23S rRNA (cytidine(2498)-2'-O)-methyltransferase RlmM [Methylococcus sp. EFPC2]QSA96059.1 23S rRNA (cytidine(2498)-2'-O)-methyltransferase RlmM [Methylococcus sp. EFPC2]